jgi:hypothetical protein
LVRPLQPCGLVVLIPGQDLPFNSSVIAMTRRLSNGSLLALALVSLVAAAGCGGATETSSPPADTKEEQALSASVTAPADDTLDQQAADDANPGTEDDGSTSDGSGRRPRHAIVCRGDAPIGEVHVLVLVARGSDGSVHARMGVRAGDHRARGPATLERQTDGVLVSLNDKPISLFIARHAGQEGTTAELRVRGEDRVALTCRKMPRPQGQAAQ